MPSRFELGGKRGKRQAIGLSGVAVAEAEFAARARQLVFDVKTRAAEARAAHAKSAALAEVVTAGREALRLTRARVAEGDAAALEGQLLAVEFARMEAQYATYRGRATAALADLRRIVGLDAAELPSVGPNPELPAPASLALSDLTARALKIRSDLGAARAVERQSTAELELARAEGVPDLTASATYTQDSDTTDGLFAVTSSGQPAPIVDNDKRISVGVSIPLFWRGRNRGNTDAAMARATAPGCTGSTWNPRCLVMSKLHTRGGPRHETPSPSSDRASSTRLTRIWSSCGKPTHLANCVSSMCSTSNVD